MGTPQYAHTRCEVHFHSDTNFDGTLGLEPHPLLGRVVGVSTSKSFGGAAGSFSVTIKKPPALGTSWAQIFDEPEGSWVRLNYLINGQPLPVLWGIVDSISENVTRGDTGQRTETYTVTGRDFGKAFEDTKTIVNLFAAADLDIFKGLLSAYNINPPIGSPDLVVKQIIDLWLGNAGLGNQQYQLPGSLADVAGAKSLFDAINFETIQTMDAGHGETLDMTVLSPDQQGGQALWDTLQQYSNGLINEMWVDLAPATPHSQRSIGRNTAFADDTWLPAFYLRERRFRTQDDTSLWDNTLLHVLERGDVRNRQLAKGGASNRYNYWVLHGGVLGDQYRAQPLTHSLGVEPFKPGAIPIINLQSMQTHGIRPYVATTNFLPFFKGGEEKRDFITLAANWLKRLHDWYGVAPFQLSGTMTLSRMHPEIRIGQRVREQRADGTVTYYVEGVDHHWSYPGAGSTTLTLTHGQYDNEVSTPLMVLYKQYEGQRVTSAASSAAVQSPDPQPNASQTVAPQQGQIVTASTPQKPQQDPQMVAALGSKDSRQAKEIAEGRSQDPLPPKQTDAKVFDQDALERQLPIPTTEES